MRLAPTFGWDIVYAVRLPEVNARIAEIKTRVHSLDCEVDGFPVKASLGQWRLVPGGSGDVVWIAMDIAEGKVERANKAPIEFHGRATLEVKLHHAVENLDDHQTAALQIRQPDPEFAKDIDSLLVRRVDLDGPRDIILESIVSAALQRWLSQHPGVIEHVFAVVDLFEGLDGQPFSWLRPTSISYAYGDAAEPDDCVLAVLAMVDNRSSDELDQHVSAMAIPYGCNAAILVSPHLLLDGIIRHIVPGAFPGLEPDDMELSEVSPLLVLREPRTLAPILHDGHERKHTLTALNVEFRRTELICECENAVEIKDRITVYTRTRTIHVLHLSCDAEGRATFTFRDLDKPEIHHRTEISKDFIDAADRAATVVGLVALIGAVLTGGVAGLVIELCGALYFGAFRMSPYIAAASVSSAPSMDLLAFNAAAPCVWAGGQKFHPDGVDLVESLRLFGNLKPQGAPA
jgi:hypothetical protein